MPALHQSEGLVSLLADIDNNQSPFQIFWKGLFLWEGFIYSSVTLDTYHFPSFFFMIMVRFMRMEECRHITPFFHIPDFLSSRLISYYYPSSFTNFAQEFCCQPFKCFILNIWCSINLSAYFASFLFIPSRGKKRTIWNSGNQEKKRVVF